MTPYRVKYLNTIDISFILHVKIKVCYHANRLFIMALSSKARIKCINEDKISEPIY